MWSWGLRIQGEAPTPRRRAECKQGSQAVQQERSVGRWGQAAAQSTAAAGDSRTARRSGGGKRAGGAGRNRTTAARQQPQSALTRHGCGSGAQGMRLASCRRPSMMCGAGLREWDLRVSGAEYQRLGLGVELQGWGLKIEGFKVRLRV